MLLGKMSQPFGVAINAVMKERDIICIREATILRTPTRPRPGQAVLQERFENSPRDFAMGHQAFLVLLEIGFLMDLEIMKIRFAHFILIDQGLPPMPRPVAEHFFI